MTRSPGRHAARTVALWVATGTAYGVVLRAWMRLIAETPEFTWSGTIAVIGVFAVLGASAGMATAGRRAGRGWSLVAVRAVGIVLSLGCFGAAGIAMLPTVVPAALGAARSDWPRWLRLQLVAIGGTAALAIVVAPGLRDQPTGGQVLGFCLYPLLCAAEVAIMARLYAPSLPRGTLQRQRAAVAGDGPAASAEVADDVARGLA